MLEIEVNFPDNLYTTMMLETEKVPCLCKISKDFLILSILIIKHWPNLQGYSNLTVNR